MKQKVIFILLFSLLISCTVVFGIENNCKKGLSMVIINNVQICVELARYHDEQKKGLSNKDALDPKEGMLFIFSEEQELSFWMKDTTIPLSIAYIDKDKVIRGIYDMTPRSLDSIQSDGKMLYALEVNKGFFEANGIKVGDKVTMRLLF